MRLSKYGSVFILTYHELRRDRCRHVRPQLFLDLNLDLNLRSYPALNPRPFKKPNALSFASKHASVPGLHLNLDLNLNLIPKPGRKQRGVGEGIFVKSRIVD